MKAKRNHMPGAVRQVDEQFSQWRGSKKDRERIPGRLWRAAVKLCDRYSVHRVSRWLHLNHTALQRRVAERRQSGRPHSPRFVECRLPVRAASVFSAAEYVVEVGGKGARIHVRGAGGAEVAALVNALSAAGTLGGD